MWDEKRRTWWLPCSWASCCALRGVFGSDLQIGPDLVDWARRVVEQRVAPALQLRDNPLGLTYVPGWWETWAEKLLAFQPVAVEFIVRGECVLIADEMGTGKTVETSAALRVLAPTRTVIIAPNSVKRVWHSHILEWAPNLVPVVYQTGPKGRQAIDEFTLGHANVLIINWENTWRLSRLKGFGSIKLTENDKAPKALNTIPIDCVVLDEAHRAKEPTAKQTRAAWAIMEEARWRIALTGTPVANSPRDLWSIMHGLVPEEYPAYTLFVDRYGLQSWNAFGGLEVVGINPTTSDEFFKIFDPRFLRRPRALVLPQLPGKFDPVRRVATMPAKQKKAYKEILKQMLTELDSGDLAYVTSPLAKLTRLRQLAAAYVEIDAEGKWKLTEPSGKLDELMAILEEAGDEQVVVFAEHSQLLKLAAARLEKVGISHGLLIGATSEDEREENVAAFQAGRLRVILANFGVGGEGLTLTAAHICVMLQRSYSLVKDKQAPDRLDRWGQTEKVQVIDIVVEDTVEMNIFDILGDKAGRLEEVCRDRDTLRRVMAGK